MGLAVLAVNAGSSSLKLRLVGADDELLGVCDLAPGDEVGAALDELGDPDAVGHRIVHGGERFSAPVVIDDAVVAALEELVVLAPLHQPKSLAALAAVRRARPGLPQVACFDTAFHAGMPAAATTYPPEVRLAFVLDNFSAHLTTNTDSSVANWAATSNVELAYVPFYASWMNRIEAQFTGLRYFALDGTDHPDHATPRAE